jgi:hypothetical protein
MTRGKNNYANEVPFRKLPFSRLRAPQKSGGAPANRAAPPKAGAVPDNLKKFFAARQKNPDRAGGRPKQGGHTFFAERLQTAKGRMKQESLL